LTWSCHNETSAPSSAPTAAPPTTTIATFFGDAGGAVSARGGDGDDGAGDGTSLYGGGGGGGRVAVDCVGAAYKFGGNYSLGGGAFLEVVTTKGLPPRINDQKQGSDIWLQGEVV